VCVPGPCSGHLPRSWETPGGRSRYNSAVSQPLRVVLFEDDPRYRQGLETLFKHTPKIDLVGTFPRLEPGLVAARREAAGWDVVLMDLEHPDGSGVHAIRALKTLRPDLPVLALTVFEEPSTVVAAICAGADGYLLKRSPASELVSAIRSAGTGGAPLSPGIASALLQVVRKTSAAPVSSPSRLDLTAREQDVLRALAAGRTYQEAADHLGIGLETVRTHVRALYRKLQVHSVGEAVARAIRDGLV
jgi:DNA-binding NarL/FixJ family response regulator